MTRGAHHARRTCLDEFFPATVDQSAFSDADCSEISRFLLEDFEPRFSTVPRLYIVLRIIDQVSVLPRFLNLGCNDLWFPFNKQSLPKSLAQSYQDQFLEAQCRVITKGLNLENEDKKYVHFMKDEVVPLLERGLIARGGYGTVDKVKSQVSGREFARKRFQRKGTRPAELKSFATELQILKRISHHHCVELIASYTDPKFFGFLMLPVAEYNLEQYFAIADSPDRIPVLRSFFGCLASALAYLHETQIRHRDIKPSNILVKGKQVFFTDFGISLDWQNRTRSTTSNDFGKSRAYCAPEVANDEKRNSKSDVFSLGCIFIEMLTLLNGGTIQDLRDSFKANNGTIFFSNNIATSKTWIRGLSVSEIDIPVVDWIEQCVAWHQDARVTSHELCKLIGNSRANELFCCEHCLLDDDTSSGTDDDPNLWTEHDPEDSSFIPSSVSSTQPDFLKSTTVASPGRDAVLDLIEEDGTLDMTVPSQQGSESGPRQNGGGSRPVPVSSAQTRNQSQTLETNAVMPEKQQKTAVGSEQPIGDSLQSADATKIVVEPQSRVQNKETTVSTKTNPVGQDLMDSFKAFSLAEKERIGARQEQTAKHDKAVKLNDLKKFHSSFKLVTPIPLDLVPILSNDEDRQREKISKALMDAEYGTARKPTREPIRANKVSSKTVAPNLAVPSPRPVALPPARSNTQINQMTTTYANVVRGGRPRSNAMSTMTSPTYEQMVYQIPYNSAMPHTTFAGSGPQYGSHQSSLGPTPRPPFPLSAGGYPMSPRPSNYGGYPMAPHPSNYGGMQYGGTRPLYRWDSL